MSYPINMNFYTGCATAVHNGQFTATSWFANQNTTSLKVFGERWSDASYTEGISQATVLLIGY